jgi:hypothetical protein
LNIVEDSTADFVTDVTVGDGVHNVTDGSWGVVETITDATHLTMNDPKGPTKALKGGIQNTMTLGDAYEIDEDPRILIDSAADFVADGVKVDDVVVNTADGCVGIVDTVDSATQLTLDDFLKGGTVNRWMNGDAYTIEQDMNQYEREVAANAILDAIPGMTQAPAGDEEDGTWPDFTRTYDPDGALPADSVDAFLLEYEIQMPNATSYIRGSEVMLGDLENLGIDLAVTTQTSKTISDMVNKPSATSWSWVFYGHPRSPYPDQIANEYAPEVYAVNVGGPRLDWGGYEIEEVTTGIWDYKHVGDVETGALIAKTDANGIAAKILVDKIWASRRMVDPEDFNDAMYEIQELFVEQMVNIQLFKTTSAMCYRTDKFTGWNPGTQDTDFFGGTPPAETHKNLLSVELID